LIFVAWQRAVSIQTPKHWGEKKTIGEMQGPKSRKLRLMTESRGEWLAPPHYSS